MFSLQIKASQPHDPTEVGTYLCVAFLFTTVVQR